MRHSQSHLHERKLKYCFQDFVILIALAGMRLKQYSLPATSTQKEWMTLLDTIRNINTNFLEQNDSIIDKDLLFENFSHCVKYRSFSLFPGVEIFWKAQFPYCFGRKRKLCLSAKFPHQEIRRNYGILRSVP